MKLEPCEASRFWVWDCCFPIVGKWVVLKIHPLPLLWLYRNLWGVPQFLENLVVSASSRKLTYFGKLNREKQSRVSDASFSPHVRSRIPNTMGWNCPKSYLFLSCSCSYLILVQVLIFGSVPMLMMPFLPLGLGWCLFSDFLTWVLSKYLLWFILLRHSLPRTQNPGPLTGDLAGHAMSFM